jgi:uncharacterized LabA/DUF88 family protein
MPKTPRTAVYVDGFNLYYGCVKNTPYQWLDIDKLLKLVLPKNEITLIKYFTARVKPTAYDPDAPARQSVYLKALQAHIPHLDVIEGRFLRVKTTVETSPGKFVKGEKSEEKGSDVNIAVHLLNDAWLDLYDVGVLVSNDTDLAQAMTLVKRDCGKTVGLVSPVCKKDRRVSEHLRRLADFQKSIRKSALPRAQLPSPIPGTGLHRPKKWNRK